MPDWGVPMELLHAIAVDVKSDAALLQLRLVSRTLNSIATPLAFRVLTVKDSVRSANALSFFQECDSSIVSSVREVAYHESPPSEDYRVWKLEPDPDEGILRRQALKTAFSGLTKFPNLRRLRFDFHDLFQEDTSREISETPSHFLRLQLDIFAALASSPSPTVVSLTLNNVLAVPDAIYAQEAFHRVFHRLEELQISVISDVDLEGSYYQEPLVQFWDESVPHMIRSAAALSSLTVRSDQAVGACPALSFKDTHFPNLASLTLEDFALEPAIPHSDVVAFILAHKATLGHLELRYCSIDGGENFVFPRPWYAVLALFEAKLGHLRTFDLNSEAKEEKDWDEPEQDLRFLYTSMDAGMGHHYRAATNGLDLLALESLMEVVNARGTSGVPAGEHAAEST